MHREGFLSGSEVFKSTIAFAVVYSLLNSIVFIFSWISMKAWAWNAVDTLLAFAFVASVLAGSKRFGSGQCLRDMVLDGRRDQVAAGFFFAVIASTLNLLHFLAAAELNGSASSDVLSSVKVKAVLAFPMNWIAAILLMSVFKDLSVRRDASAAAKLLVTLNLSDDDQKMIQYSAMNDAGVVAATVVGSANDQFYTELEPRRMAQKSVSVEKARDVYPSANVVGWELTDYGRAVLKHLILKGKRRYEQAVHRS